MTIERASPADDLARELAVRELWTGADAPRWWHVFRDAYDVVLSSMPLDPGRVLAFAGALGRAMHIVTGSPSPELIAGLMPGGTVSPSLRAAARAASALRYQNRALISLIRRRGSRVMDLLLDPGVDRAVRTIPRPAVLAVWHAGPAFGIGAAVEHAGVPMLTIRRDAGPVNRGRRFVTSVSISGDFNRRFHAATLAVKQLRQGGIVAVAADGEDGALLPPVPCLGRMVRLPRGPFSLARIAGGVPIVPIVSRWNEKGLIELVVGQPLPATPSRGKDAELAFAAAAARWIEEYFLSNPGEIWLRTLRWLARWPKVG